MLVKATDKYEKLNLKDNELGRIPEAGEEFEVSEERFKVLTQTNRFNVKFVEKVKEKETSIEEQKKLLKSTAKKTTRKRKQ